MELKREMFFNGDELDASKVVKAIMEHSSRWEEIIEFIWEVMQEEFEYEFEKKWLKMKYEHDMKELKEKFNVLDDKH